MIGSFKDWVEQALGWTVEVVKRPSRWFWVAPGQEPPTLPDGFHVLPYRWIVERTFSWPVRQRRLSKDYERLVETAETWIYLTGIRLILGCLA